MEGPSARPMRNKLVLPAKPPGYRWTGPMALNRFSFALTWGGAPGWYGDAPLVLSGLGCVVIELKLRNSPSFIRLPCLAFQSHFRSFMIPVGIRAISEAVGARR